MNIRIAQDLKTEVLVINKFQDEFTSQELVNKYAVEKDKFEGKIGQTYLLHTFGEIEADKILVIGCGKKSEFTAAKIIEVGGKRHGRISKTQALHCNNAKWPML